MKAIASIILTIFILGLLINCSSPSPKTKEETNKPDSTFSDSSSKLMEDTALVDYSPTDSLFVDEEEEGPSK